MIPGFIQGNVAPLHETIARMTMDSQDLQLRLDKALNDLRRLQIEHERLQAQAYALVWLVPGDKRVGELQRLYEEAYKILRPVEEKAFDETRAALPLTVEAHFIRWARHWLKSNRASRSSIE